MVDKAIFDWLLSMRSRNVPLSAAMIKEKAITFAKELNIGDFQHHVVGYDVKRKETT